MLNNLKKAIIDNMDSKTALKQEHMPLEENKRGQLKSWKDAVEAVRESVCDAAQAAKRKDKAAYEEAANKFFPAYKAALIFLQDSPEEAYAASGTELESLLPHSGSFRKDKETGEYSFTPVGAESFRKAFEKTLASQIINRKMKTVSEIREERKAKAEAEKARKAAEKEADKAASVPVRPETLTPNNPEKKSGKKNEKKAA